MDDFIIKMIDELAVEHNKAASFLEFIIRKLIEKDIITTDELQRFLQETEYFNVQDSNTIVPDEKDMIQKLEEDIEADKKSIIEKIFKE
jgi:hypothetical protein